MSEHTPTPWKWCFEDASVLAIYGPDGDEDHVLWAGICPACQETGGRCTAPSDADANHIVRCVNAHQGLVAALTTCIAQLDVMDCPAHVAAARAALALATNP